MFATSLTSPPASHLVLLPPSTSPLPLAPSGEGVLKKKERKKRRGALLKAVEMDPPFVCGCETGSNSPPSLHQEVAVRQLVQSWRRDDGKTLLFVRMHAAVYTRQGGNCDPMAAPLPADGSHTFRGPWLFLLTSNLCCELASHKIYRLGCWNSTESLDGSKRNTHI